MRQGPNKDKSAVKYYGYPVYKLKSLNTGNKWCGFGNFLNPLLILLIISVTFTRELTLESYMKRVVSESYARAESGFKIDELDALQKQSELKYLPSISYSLITTQSEQGPRDVFIGSIPIRQPAASYEYHSTSVSISQQIFDWGNSLREKKKHALRKEVIKADFLRQARLISEMGISLYFRLAETLEILNELKKTLSDTRKEQVILNELVDRGLKPFQDKLRMNITINEILSEISSQKMTASELYAEISYLLNEPIDTTVVLMISREPMRKVEPLSQTPDMLYLTGLIKVYETELSISKWDRLPDFYVNTGYSRGSETFKSVFSDFNEDWNTYISLSLSLPITGKNRQDLQKTQNEIQLRRLTRQLQDEQDKNNKKNAVLIEQIRRIKEKIKLQEENINNLESIYSYDLKRYHSGIIDYKALKNSKNNYSLNKQILITQKYKLMECEEIFKLHKGGWDDVIVPVKIK